MTTTAIIPAAQTIDLAVIDEHIRSLELATDIHDIVKQHSAAGALEHFAKEADLPLETQNRAAEWRIRAQRRGVQVLRGLPRGKGGVRHRGRNGGREVRQVRSNAAGSIGRTNSSCRPIGCTNRRRGQTCCPSHEEGLQSPPESTGGW